MNIHEKYIKRCIQIAKNGLGTTAPNPSVGCVIVCDNLIIGEGFTSPFGGNHAEVNAIASVADKSLLHKATLYVTLEPCSHFGKTPPCTNLIIESKIPKVVIGAIDTHAKVAGKGIAALQESGCETIVSVCEEECKAHHKRFFTFHNKKRPYIILKWAESTDGFIAPSTKLNQEPVWISNELSQQLVHKWRSEEQAILAGTRTVLEDNPNLTVRSWTGRNPVRIVLDRTNKLAKTLNIFNKDAITIRISKNEVNFNDNLAFNICSYLYDQNIQSIIIEGGTKTLQTFINESLWDEARVFIGSSNLINGTKGPVFSYQPISEASILNDTLKIYFND